MGSNPIVQTALVKCSFGAAPASVVVQSQPTVKMGGMLAATIMDNKPLVFGTCTSPAHPVVSSTGSPGPCLGPAQIAAPWTPGSPTVKICGRPAANKSCKLMCNFGGVIEMTMTPAVTVKIG